MTYEKKVKAVKRREDDDSEEDAILWHTAFPQAVRAELLLYKHGFEYRDEHQLTTAPLKIDVMVIKKIREMRIEKNFARIFRQFNILEYKSPEVNATKFDYFKVRAYTSLCAYMEQVELNEMSMTMFVSTYPRNLLAYLERDFKVKADGAGIYSVFGEPYPVQIVLTSELRADENVWLKSLRRNLTCEEMRHLYDDEIANQDKNVQLDAYIDVVSRANSTTLKEAIEIMGQTTFDEIISSRGWYIKAKEDGIIEGEARGEAKGKAESVLSAIKIRFSSVPGDIKKKVMTHSDTVALDSLLQCAITCNSIEDFRKNL